MLARVTQEIVWIIKCLQLQLSGGEESGQSL